MARRAFAWLNPALAAAAAACVAAIAWRASTGRLGPRPVVEALHQLGFLALVALLATLACTPLRKATGWTWPARVRRTLGVIAFSFAVLHAGVYAGLDKGWMPSAILADARQRTFIFAGFGALVLLLPLALTSTDGAVRRLGHPRWTRLHRLVYPAAVLAVLHFAWQAGADPFEPLIFAAILAGLLLFRLLAARRARTAV
jgi:sulfoxide reductase heme-binding subunit YedZ